VLNPYVQPWTAKPWGYAGAPGHPFAQKWWETLDATPWRGWRASADLMALRAEAKKRVVEEGIADFEKAVRREFGHQDQGTMVVR
jgi:hypothetical protein